MIPTKIHGILDYLTAVLFLFMPGILGLDSNSVPAKVFLYLGVITILYSLVTRYELGLVKLLPMKFHLALDFLSGIFLALSPWLLGFSNEIYVPFVLFGLFEIAVTWLSKPSAGKEIIHSNNN